MADLTSTVIYGYLQVNDKIEAPTLTLTQPTGITPIKVASTTVVDNLNADLLDGQHGTYYAKSDHTHSYAPLAFSTIKINNQIDIVADSTGDTLTFVAGAGITLTTNDTTDTITIGSPDTNTDTLVTQTATTTNSTYPILLTNVVDKTGTTTDTSRFAASVKVNPSTNTIFATTFNGNLTGNVTGTATPLSHTHGNISNAGAIGTTTGLIVKTTTAGVLTTLPAGTTAEFLRGDGTWNTISTDNFYPTSLTWTDGTSSGPTGTLSGSSSGMASVSIGAIPSASGTTSGVITTGAQTIAGAKTFSSNIIANITGNVSGSSGSCTGNSATATTASSCTGNAATATKLSTNRTNYVTNETTENVVGQLAWQNYGSNHTIFDASKGISPSGTAVNNTNPAVVWSATYPTLMGWNGSSTYGVRTYISNTTDAIATVSVYTGTTNPTSDTRVNIDGYVYATRVYNAVYNDYAECFENKTLNYENTKNRIVELDINNNTILAGEDSTMVIGIISDNYAFLINGSNDDVKSGTKIPVGLAGQLYVDSKEKVDINNRGKFITSAGEGYAKVNENPKLGTIIGKIIGIDEVKNQYKVIITLI